MNRSPELLAPAGSVDAAWAALAYGANAVYAGLPRFSARAEAVNFTHEQLDELIGYAHALDRKVYITFNTLVQQHELPAALEALAQIYDLNADGVIVQDMGVARMAKRFFPTLNLHASTQLAVHNLAGAKLLADLGFTRVVLARELSLQEIETITRGCGIETEVFIHGALCYSYSGLCLFSSHRLSRSGNRGRCAYCCRQTFETEAGKTLPFAMKDFAVGSHFEELLKTGVSSLKIEGRMKGAEYVGAVTDFYRKRLGAPLSTKEQQQLLSDIQTIFGRPATDLYLKNAETNPIDPTTNGHRGAVVGTIQSIRPEQGDHWLHFNTDRALQKFDGLKIEIPGQEPFGFSATEIRLQNDRKKHLKFEVPAHTDIAVKLPPNHPYLESGLTVYCSISQEVRQRYRFETPRPGVYRQQHLFDVTIKLTPDGLTLRANSEERRRDALVAFHTEKGDEGVAATLPISAELHMAEPLSEARNPDKTEASVRKCFEKTGGTEWKLNALDLEDNGLFVPASILNEARRQLLEKLSVALAESKTAAHAQRLQDLVVPPAPPSSTAERWSIKLRDLSLLDELTDKEWSRIEEIVLESDAPSEPESNATARTEPRPPIRIAIPVIQRGREGCPQPSAAEWGHSALPIEVANVGALYNHRQTTNLIADWPLYTLNSEAAEQWKKLGIQQHMLSPEDTGENLKALLRILGDRAIVPAYQYTPLMISASRPDSGAALSDRNQRAMRIEQNGNQYVLIDEAPFSLIGHMDELRANGARCFRIDLTYGVDSAPEAARIIRRVIQEEILPDSHDGNWAKTL